MKNFLKKLINPFKLIITELKLVEWLTLKQTVNSTLLVLAVSLFVGIMIVAFDIIFYRARNIII